MPGKKAIAAKKKAAKAAKKAAKLAERKAEEDLANGRVEKVKVANAIQDLFVKYKAFSSYKRPAKDTDITLKFYQTHEAIPEAEQKWMWSLLETNMRTMYEACKGWSWKEGEKQRELQSEENRFIVGYDTKTNEPVVFSNFRFMMEGQVPVLYVFEIQLIPAFRRKGLGKHLTGLLELVAWQTGMEWCMLTCLKENVAAVNFYTKLKYEIDETDPSMNEYIDVSPEEWESGQVGYQIMSKENPIVAKKRKADIAKLKAFNAALK
jgi:ribosomal protein S18 acetylase RimI-like enzyme